MWTRELDEWGCKLWRETSLSGSQIANVLGNGFTRNAVISRAWRKGWGLRTIFQRKPKPQPKQRKSKRMILRKEPEPPSVLVVETPPNNTIGVLFIDLDATSCQWPLADTGINMICCGKPTLFGKTYCATHHVVSWTQPRPRSGGAYSRRERYYA